MDIRRAEHRGDHAVTLILAAACDQATEEKPSVLTEGIFALGVQNHAEKTAVHIAANHQDDDAVVRLLNWGASITNAAAGYAEVGDVGKTTNLLKCGANLPKVIRYAIMGGNRNNIVDVLSELRKNTRDEQLNEIFAYAYNGDNKKVMSIISQSSSPELLALEAIKGFASGSHFEPIPDFFSQYLGRAKLVARSACIGAVALYFANHNDEPALTQLKKLVSADKHKDKYLDAILDAEAQGAAYFGNKDKLIQLLTTGDTKRRAAWGYASRGDITAEQYPEFVNSIILLYAFNGYAELVINLAEKIRTNGSSADYVECVQHAIEGAIKSGQFDLAELILQKYVAPNAEYKTGMLKVTVLQMEERGYFLRDEQALRALVFCPSVRQVAFDRASNVLLRRADEMEKLMQAHELTYNAARIVVSPEFKRWFKQSYVDEDKFKNATEFRQALMEKAFPGVELLARNEERLLFQYASDECIREHWETAQEEIAKQSALQMHSVVKSLAQASGAAQEQFRELDDITPSEQTKNQPH